MNVIEQETNDLSQGRIPKSVFARHYLRSDFINDSRIRLPIGSLRNDILNDN